MADPINIKSLRERLGWTQQEMADYLGIDRTSVSRLESGQEPHGSTQKLLEQLAPGDPAGLQAAEAGP